MLVLFCDSDCDVTPKIAKEYGYHMISMPYTANDRTVYPYEDFEEFDCHAFYEMLRGGTVPTTSAISEERYVSYFEPHFAAGDDILYVHFSRAMSATFDNMDKAVAKLKEKYPERRFYEIDTKAITIPSLNIAIEIGELYKAGRTVEEILDWAKTEVDKFAVYFFADDLKFFQRSGRVGGLAGTMGTLLGIRPIIYMSAEGKMESIGKEKGRNKALARLISYVEELGENVKDHRVIIAHCDCLPLAEMAAAELKKRFGDDLNILYSPVNPTAGSHCGPNCIGICFHAKHR